MTLLIYNISEHSVLEIPENMEDGILDRSVLPLSNEAAHASSEPLHAIENVMKVMKFRLQACAELRKQIVEFDSQLPKSTNSLWCSIRPCAEHAKD